MAIRIPLHAANDGNAITPADVGNIFPNPHTRFRDKGYFLPCNCLDLCPAITENNGSMVGLKFELGIVPQKSKGTSVWWENLATCPGVQIKLTYEDILGVEIQAITPGVAVTFADDWCDVDTSKRFDFNTAGEAGYIGRGNVGILVLEILADPNNTLVSDCCNGAGTCNQPMLQWALHYDPVFIDRAALLVCDDDQNGRDLSCVDCPPEARLTAWGSSVRKTELGL